ncbi:MAG TPA: MFS transporter [Steroidobacteraceae bacterium]|nr:MFS transporter [Steroidobacteraceae bacterium]
MASSEMPVRPVLSFWQIWNMCFGFLGLQFGFALQNANVSRIFQTLGASLDAIPSLWIAAPLTGLLVQPIIGYCSDRTWTRLGRRRPYFLVGALLASVALIAMPRSAALWIAAGLLWMLDASINVSMEPFRAFVGDQLGPAQRPTGYSMQSFFIGVGSVVASALPWTLTRMGVSNHATGASGLAAVPDSLRYSFDLGAAVLFLAIGWTVLRTREYPPEVLHGFRDSVATPEPAGTVRAAGGQSAKGLIWALLGLAGLITVTAAQLDKQLYLVGAGALLWGLALLAHHFMASAGFFGTIMRDLEHMPHTMRRLIPVQFFSWLALFAMWIYTTPAVTQVHFHSTDPASAAYNDGADWVGVLFGAYNGFAALAAVFIPLMVRRFGLRRSHLLNVWLGGVGFLSIAFIRDPHWLLLSMVGVGFAWASILSIPYALLSDSVPSEKMGLYMGIFNFFIVIPQLVAASVLGFLLKTLFGGAPIRALTLGGVCFLIAGLLALRVPEPGDPPRTISG